MELTGQGERFSFWNEGDFRVSQFLERCCPLGREPKVSQGLGKIVCSEGRGNIEYQKAEGESFPLRKGRELYIIRWLRKRLSARKGGGVRKHYNIKG